MPQRSKTYRAFVLLLLAWLLRTIVPVAPRVEWSAVDAESDARGDALFACVDHDCCCRTREQCHTACCCIDAAPRVELGAPVGDRTESVATSVIDVLGRRVRVARLELRAERRAMSVLTPLSCEGGIPGEMSVPGSSWVAMLPTAPQVAKIVPSIVPWPSGVPTLDSAESPKPLVPPPRVTQLV